MSSFRNLVFGLAVAGFMAETTMTASAALILSTNQSNYGVFQPGETFDVEVLLSQTGDPPILLGDYLLELAAFTLEVDGPHQIIGFTASPSFPAAGNVNTSATPASSLDVFLDDLPGSVPIPGVGDPGLSLGVVTIQTGPVSGVFTLFAREFDTTPNSFDFSAVNAIDPNDILFFDPTTSPTASFEVTLPQNNGVPEPGTLLMAGLVLLGATGWRRIRIQSGSRACNSGERNRPSTRIG